MFGYNQPADKLFEYHKRHVDNGDTDEIEVIVFNEEYDEIYYRSTDE
jgi:hypothetical protein